MNSLLAVDIGNSTIGFGLFLEPIKSQKMFAKKIPTHPAQSTEIYKKIISDFIRQSMFSLDKKLSSKQYAVSSKGKNINNKSAYCLLLTAYYNIDAVISSVVPSIDLAIIEAITNICGRQPLIVNHKNCGLTFHVKRSEEIGADRIANAVAGFNYFKRPVAVIDFGTATTITVIGRQEHFLGGTIMPGIDMMQMALYSGTAKLPAVRLKVPKTVLGKDTVSSVTSGIIHGTTGAVESLIKGMEKELGFRLKLVLTGGHAKLMSPLIKRDHHLAPTLTFEGLRLIYLRTGSKQ